MTEKRFIGSSGGVYDQYKSNRFVWSEWEEILQIMNNLNEKARERSKALSKLQKENKQLKEYNLRIDKILGEGGVILTKNQLKSLIEMKNDDEPSEIRHLRTANAKLKDENQSLKNHIQMLQKHIKRLENDNIKTYTLIKEAYTNERTSLGRSVLKQLLNSLD